MKDIGEYRKNQEILLELLTNVEESEPIHTDFPPSAILEYYGGNGLIEAPRVTLEEAKNGLFLSRHTLPKESHVPMLAHRQKAFKEYRCPIFLRTLKKVVS